MENQSSANKEITKGEKDSKRVHSQLTEAEKLMPELRTLAYCNGKAIEDGFTENFKATEKGLESMETGKKYDASQVQVVNFYRFEGITDPADMSVLYVLKMSDGAQGTLVDAYGTYADFDVAKVIRQIDEIAKKNTTK